MTSEINNPVPMPKGVIVAAVLMIIFGLAEIAISFIPKIMEPNAPQSTLSIIIAVIIGAFYLVSGVFVLTKTRSGAITAVALLLIDATARICLAMAGLWPAHTVVQVVALIIGTAVVFSFSVYIELNLRFFK